MASSLANYLNNRNAALISMLVLLVLFGLTAWQWTWWSGAIENNGKDYRIALKFDESNAAEFPYSIKTQQGKMYAKGNITTPDKLLTDDNLSIERIFITILMIVGSLALTYVVFTSLRQVKDYYDN